MNKAELIEVLTERLGTDRRHANDAVEHLIDAIVRAKPASARGRYVHSITLAATMSPALRIDVAKYVKL